MLEEGGSAFKANEARVVVSNVWGPVVPNLNEICACMCVWVAIPFILDPPVYTHTFRCIFVHQPGGRTAQEEG